MIAALLLAQIAAGPPAPIEARRQTLFVTWNAESKSCLPRINGVEIADIGTDAGKAALAHALPDKGLRLHVLATADSPAIPYACMSEIVQTLRDAGYYGRIVTVAEPPPPQAPNRR